MKAFPIYLTMMKHPCYPESLLVLFQLIHGYACMLSKHINVYSKCIRASIVYQAHSRAKSLNVNAMAY